MNYILFWIGVNKSTLEEVGFKLLLREKRELPEFENNQTANETIHLMISVEKESQFIVIKSENGGKLNSCAQTLPND